MDTHASYHAQPLGTPDAARLRAFIEDRMPHPLK